MQKGAEPKMQADINALLAGIPLPVLFVDPDARISAANDKALALLGTATLGRHHGLTLRQPEVLHAITQEMCIRDRGSTTSWTNPITSIQATSTLPPMPPAWGRWR